MRYTSTGYCEMGHVWVGKYPARTLSTLAMDSDSCHAAEPSATLPVCVGGRGVHVGSGVDVGGGSGVDVRDGRGVDFGGGRGVQVAVGQTVDVADGSGSGTVVGVGVAAGDPLHAARIRTLRAASSSWRPRWTERQNPYVDRAKSNLLLAFSSRIVVEEHCGTVRSDASFETHVGAAAKIAVQNPVRMVNSLELLHPGLNPRSRLESAIPPSAAQSLFRSASHLGVGPNRGPEDGIPVPRALLATTACPQSRQHAAQSG